MPMPNDPLRLRLQASHAYKRLRITDLAAHMGGHGTENPVLSVLIDAVTAENERLRTAFAKQFTKRLSPAIMAEATIVLQLELNLDY